MAVRVRLKDIAHDLGISPMAVSKALRNHKDISDETKKRVLKRAEELNYRVDWVARSMVTGRTYLVGLVVPDLMQSFFAEIATALASVLSPVGYHLMISHTRESAADEAANIDLLVSRKVDGLVVASAQRDAAAFGKLKVPCVLVDRLPAGFEGNFVGTRNEEVGRLATVHLVEQGCRRIAHLKGPSLSIGAGRLRGYRSALKAHGLPADRALVVEAGHDDVAGYQAMRRLLASASPPDGVFCFNDPVAVGAMRAIREAGLSMPADIAVVGAGNMHYSDMLQVPLTTVDQRTSEMGLRAAELLLEHMGASRPVASHQVLVPAGLVVRDSSLRRPA